MAKLSSITTIRIRLISAILGLLEDVFFYPKLRKVITNLLLDSLDQPSKILDIGGNRGQSVKFFRSIFPSAQIISFEPIPELAEKIRYIEDFNLIVYQTALSDMRGTANFYESKLDETSSLNPPNLESTWHRFRSHVLGVSPDTMFQKIEVQVETLDNLFVEKSNWEFMLMKIDVEGSELQVLKGSRALLKNKSFNVIQLERHRDDLRVDSFPDIQNLLASYGYRHIISLKHPFGNFTEEIFQK